MVSLGRKTHSTHFILHAYSDGYRRPGIYNLLTNLYHDHVFHTDM